MKYFLQNIAQASPMRTIILVLFGLVFWVLSFFSLEPLAAVAATLVGTIINSWLVAQVLFLAGMTKFPSPFAATTYWVAMSALPILHTCWQAQLLGVSILTSLLILLTINQREEITEESFLISLIWSFLSPTRAIFVTAIILFWIYLIAKGHMTWRVWAASLMAIALRVLLMAGLHYWGWMEWLWMENIPTLMWHEWVIFASAFVGVSSILLLSIRKPSIASGAIYVLCLIGLLTIGLIQTIG